MQPSMTTKSPQLAGTGWQPHALTNSTKFAVALALFLAAIMAVAGGTKGNLPVDATALPFSAKTGNETPVRATKGDRLDIRPETRRSPV